MSLIPQAYVRSNPWPFYLSWGLSFGLLLFISCSERLRRRYAVLLLRCVVVHSWECLPVSNMQNLTTYLPLQVAHQHGAAHPLHPLSGVPGGSGPSTLAALLAVRPSPPLHHQAFHLSTIKGSAAISSPLLLLKGRDDHVLLRH